MNVDWDDTPQHLKRKRQSAGKWVVLNTIGVVFSGLSIYVADRKLPFSPEPSIAQVHASKIYKPKYEFIEPTGYPATTPEQVFWDDVKERNRQQVQPKRTIYNDTNYAPQTHHNSCRHGSRASITFSHLKNTIKPKQRALERH